MPATFLIAYAISRIVAARWKFKCVGPAMLLGVWLTGGLFMTLAAMASGSGLAGNGVWQLVVIALSVIPVVTFVLAASDGSLFALVAVTLGAALLCGVRASWMLLLSTPSRNGTRSTSEPASKAA
ncbi:MAG TPA: hypothetical protein VFO39_00210 [Candidatus Sulfotelmatobacter sp.]|nr:hypothetical protein [Candidatus Sulfotelmatobacter sp.]